MATPQLLIHSHIPLWLPYANGRTTKLPTCFLSEQTQLYNIGDHRSANLADREKLWANSHNRKKLLFLLCFFLQNYIHENPDFTSMDELLYGQNFCHLVTLSLYCDSKCPRRPDPDLFGGIRQHCSATLKSSC
jgi:hypothetical protein